jgi:toxin-antitoxin system PIN domain toxin
MTKTYLPDINFWVALVFDTHTHHASANSWFNILTDELCSFCRVSQQGFLRLANNPRAFPGDAVSMAGAWQLFDTTSSDPRVTFADEPANLEALWRSFTHNSLFAPNMWTDAYLAAFAVASGFEAVTFDKAFTQYPGLAVTVLP